eukprot:PhF_6_TR27365/c0_g1_i2/m.40251
MFPSPPLGFFVDPQTSRTTAPRAQIVWGGDDFVLKTTENIEASGTILWEEPAAYIFSTDPASPLNTPANATTGTNIMNKRIAALPLLLAKQDFTKKILTTNTTVQEGGLGLQIAFLTRLFAGGNAGDVERTLDWVRKTMPWPTTDMQKYSGLYGDESDVRSVATLSACVMQGNAGDVERTLDWVRK